jgi:hypothetical protein
LESEVSNKKTIDNSLPHWITNTAGWTSSQLSELLERVKKNLGWDKTTGSAAKWWTAFENENRERLALVVRLAEELQHRRATITDFLWPMSTATPTVFLRIFTTWMIKRS